MLGWMATLSETNLPTSRRRWCTTLLVSLYAIHTYVCMYVCMYRSTISTVAHLTRKEIIMFEEISRPTLSSQKKLKLKKTKKNTFWPLVFIPHGCPRDSIRVISLNPTCDVMDYLIRMPNLGSDISIRTHRQKQYITHLPFQKKQTKKKNKNKGTMAIVFRSCRSVRLHEPT